MKETGRWCEEK